MARSSLRTPLDLALVGVVIFVLGVTILPAMGGARERFDLLGTADVVSRQILVARQEAMSQGVPVVVRLSEDGRSMIAFANVDLDAGYRFQPEASEEAPGYDRHLLRFELSASHAVRYGGVDLDRFRIEAPSGAAPRQTKTKSRMHPSRAMAGFTVANTGEHVLVFNRYGILRDEGAIRITSDGLNVVEVQVARSGRLRLRKYQANTPAEPPAFRERDDSMGGGWTWY